jgi:type IV pilus assembly protein PilA
MQTKAVTIRKLGNKRGFTLVELMIVVAIIGILASLAIFGVKKYLTSAKSGEAKANLGRLVKDAISAFERESMSGALLGAGEAVAAIHQLCPTAAPVPTSVPKGEKIQPDPVLWNGTGWGCLRFSVNSPVYYQYTYTATDPTDPATAAFSTTAIADFNGDGTFAAVPWTFNGGILDGVMRAAPTMIEASEPDE